MNVNIYNQLFNLLIFILTGIVIGILFDIFRIIRRSFKTPDFITYIEDVLFWSLTGFILLFTIFTFNNGEIRLYIFIGLLFGLTIYLLTISKYLIKASVKIITLFKEILSYPIKVIINFVKNFIIHPFSLLFSIIKSRIAKIVKTTNKKTKNKELDNIYTKVDE